jgi:hypothetical protein
VTVATIATDKSEKAAEKKEAKADRAKPKTLRTSIRTEEFGKFKSGQAVEYDGKLAKVVSFGFQELTVAPGEDRQFSDGPVLTLQLPADSPGGPMHYAYLDPPDEATSLSDNPERKRTLEKEWNPFFGDPVPEEPSKEKAEAPKIRQSGAAPEAKRTSSTRGKEGKETPAGTPPPRDTTGPGKIDTSKPAETPKAEKKAAAKETAKTAKETKKATAKKAKK